MNIIFYLKLYALTVPIFFAIDIIWLGFVAKKFYRNNLGFILSPDVNWLAAISFYSLYILGILIFAVVPALEKDSLGKALLRGSLYGFFTYATYDLTNMATIKNWPLKVVMVDILWGVFLCSTVASISFFIGKWVL
ncbi:MAG: DUF2177 family protein [Deltaproteobacteria bacterium]|jgi:uncharacterized membrane protein|nr:DUF2177 family protein [Deltaproteobacteria bacterium]